MTDVDGSDGFTGLYLSPNSLSCTHYICTAFHVIISQYSGFEKREREKAKKTTLTFTLLTLPHSLSEHFSWREQAVMMSSLLERPTWQGTEGELWPTACEEQSPPPPHTTT